MFDKEQSYKELFSSLSSFYSDYIVDDKLMKTIVVSYMHALDMLIQWTNDTFRNVCLNTAETTRTLPYLGFDASGGMYTFTRIASMPRVTFILGLPNSYTQEEIIEYWKYAALPSQKIAILNQMGLYIELVTGDYMNLALEGESAKRYKATVISEGTELYYQGRKMKEGIDYVIKDNKLYFLDMLKFDIENPNVILRNITLDYDMAWRRTGCYLGVRYEPYSEVIEKVEYNLLNKLFIKIASTGPVLADINTALQEMFASEGVCMYDAFSRNNEKDYFWKASAPTPAPITDDGKSVSIVGDTIFQFENGELIDDNVAVLEAMPVGIKNPTYAWYYAKDGIYEQYEGENSETFSLPVDSPSFGDTSSIDDVNAVEIQLVCTDGETGKQYYAYTVVNKIDKLKYVTEAAYLKGRPLSQFDFVVALPRGYATPGIADQDSKVDMLANYLKIIKPAYSYFVLSWVEVIGGNDSDGSEDIIPEDFRSEIVHSDTDCEDEIDVDDNTNQKHFEQKEEFCPTVTTNILDYTEGIYSDTYKCLTTDEEPFIGATRSSYDYSEEEKQIDNLAFENISIFLNTFPEAPTGLGVAYSEGVVKIGFNNSGVGASSYEVYRNDDLILSYEINSTNRDDRIIVTDGNFKNIKTDKYKVRTFYKGKIEGEEKYSHFIEGSVSR